MNAIKIEINLDAVNTMTADELKTHLIGVRNSVNVLKGHLSDVKEKITNIIASSFAVRWPFKEGQLVKVTYNPFYGSKPHTEIGYFLRFGKSCSYRLDEVFLVLSNVKKDGTMGKRTTEILAKNITNIEPYEIPYVNKK